MNRCETCNGRGFVPHPWVEDGSDGQPYFTTVDIPCRDCPKQGCSR